MVSCTTLRTLVALDPKTRVELLGIWPINVQWRAELMLILMYKLTNSVKFLKINARSDSNSTHPGMYM